MDSEDRISTAASFLLQSPPGEINEVLNDIRNIISDDSALETGITSALKEYNVEQFVTVSVPGFDHQVLISEAARLPQEGDEPSKTRYVDPRSKHSFEFDHLRLTASDPQPIEVDETSEPLRFALQETTIKYVADHYANGVGAVFATSNEPSTRYIIQFVANKYNPPNFWSGRWRSSYIVDLEEGKVTGKIFVNVHYYEQGNVQLSTEFKCTLDLATKSIKPDSAHKVLAIIEAQETVYQTSLGNIYFDMGETTFKALRRALPITKQKLDWDRVMGYKLGAELSGVNNKYSNMSQT